MGFDFTVAITPSNNLEKEMQYIKAALLYADRITLISPVAYLYTQLSTDGKKLDELAVLRMFESVLPLCKNQKPELYREGVSAFNQLKPLLRSKKYKAIPVLEKIKIRKELLRYAQEMDEVLLEVIGESYANELQLLLKSEKLVLQPFEHNLADLDGITAEYFGMLTKSVKAYFRCLMNYLRI